jgi:hypothetical protein
VPVGDPSGDAVAAVLLVLIGARSLPLWIVSTVVFACPAVITPAGALCFTLRYGDARAEQEAKTERAAGAERATI